MNFLEDRRADLRIDGAGPTSDDRNAVEERQGVIDRVVDDLADALAMQQHSQAFRLEAAPLTGAAGHLHHEVAQLLPDGVTSGFVEAPLDVLEDTFPTGLVLAFELPAVHLELEGLVRDTMQQHVLGGRRQRTRGSAART